MIGAYPEAPTAQRLGGVDVFLLVLFLLAIYLNLSIQITSKMPFPNAPAGFIGLLLLWRQRHHITQPHVGGFLLVFLIYLASIFAAPNPLPFFGKRFTGLVQLTYSLVLGYSVFLTITAGSRQQAAKIFLWFCLAIIVGSLLEDYTGFRAISDRFRLAVFHSGIYDADLRDQILYGRIRPKLFTSEPSFVTFAFTVYAFAWFMFSQWRWKLLGYLALIGVGQFAMPGPTLLLALALVVPYELFLGGTSRKPGMDVHRFMRVAVLGLVLAALFVTVGLSLYSERLHQLNTGRDASFFFRETGPALVARYVVEHFPIAGAGLTSERMIATQVLTVYERSSAFSSAWQIPNIAEVLTNYFWTHWIYLGIVFGLAALGGLTAWLRLLKVPSPAFCWAVWAILGQAMGAYVGPRTWFALFVAAAAAVLHQQAWQVVAPSTAAPIPTNFRLRQRWPALSS